mgnify:CR=1 FL=1
MKRKERKIKDEKKRKKNKRWKEKKEKRKEILKNGGLRDAARRWKEKSKRKCNGCGPLAELPSAAPGTREGSGMPLVGADAHVGTGTRKGQGVKTEAVDASEKLQLHYWNWRTKMMIGIKIGITPATQQAMQTMRWAIAHRRKWKEQNWENGIKLELEQGATALSLERTNNQFWKLEKWSWLDARRSRNGTDRGKRSHVVTIQGGQ